MSIFYLFPDMYRIVYAIVWSDTQECNECIPRELWYNVLIS